MTAPVSLGFLQPAPHRVTAAEPGVSYGDSRPLTAGRAENWDYNAPIRAEWPFTADLPGLLNDCGLDDTTRIIAVLSWHSTWTNLRGAGTPVTVTDGANEATIEIPGALIGGVLTLTLTVTVGTPAPGTRPPAPHRPGSPLWAARRTVTLEGSAARMPVMAVDFAASGIGRQYGLWVVECGNDLTAAVTGSLIIYVNTGHPDTRRLLDRPADPESVALAQFLAYDVTRQLVVRALQHDELDDHATYEPGTVGDLLLTVLRSHLPGRHVDQVRREYRDDPGQIDAEILAHAWTAPS